MSPSSSSKTALLVLILKLTNAMTLTLDSFETCRKINKNNEKARGLEKNNALFYRADGDVSPKVFR